ncbi:MAG: hypothetical protein RDU24_11900 [Humidesulfovibrio sp.]|uniref:hypothetical protein n=1 Tax=Humidesulfovibrio sp. TaxID=2910988 RepID=UPI0027EBDC6F|nr:hypothetical protein [Humidesulfovibrio sp.]MDQ7836077.1 hypothetical protein [Humidesulfovibrio sp.]
MHQPCGFHDQFMEQIRDALVGLKDQMRVGIGAVAEQSKANGETLLRIAESQTARRELCARQAERLVALERGADQHREAHAQSREEHLAERADLWSAVNRLRFHVYVGLGVGLVLQLAGPFVLAAVLK